MGREGLPEVRKGSGGHPKGLVGVGWSSRWSGRGQDAIPEVREGSGGPP